MSKIENQEQEVSIFLVLLSFRELNTDANSNCVHVAVNVLSAFSPWTMILFFFFFQLLFKCLQNAFFPALLFRIHIHYAKSPQKIVIISTMRNPINEQPLQSQKSNHG